MTAYGSAQRLRNLAFCGLLASGGAFASQIEFIHQGIGSGTLNGVTFSDAAFTITDFGDTAARQSCSGDCYFIDDTSASISIAGVGLFSFVTATRTFVNQDANLVGFSRAGLSGEDLFYSAQGSVFASYDLLTSIGPVAGTGTLLQWSASPVVTSGGTLVFDDAFGVGASSFQAITAAVPEPGTWALMLTGVAGLGWIGRKRR